MNVKESIINFMRNQAYKPMEIRELAAVFDISKGEYKEFKKVIKVMEKEGLIVKTNTDKLGLTEKMGLVPGRLQAHQKGFGFVIPDEEGLKDVFIPSSFINGAMNGDKVVAKVTKEDFNGKKREGEIIRITERTNTTIIGVYESSSNFGFVIPEDKRIQNDIFIPKNQKNGADDNDVVIVEITEWPGKRRNPEGKVLEILGKKGEDRKSVV